MPDRLQTDVIDLPLNEYLLQPEITDDWISSQNYYGATLDVVEDVTMTELTSALDLGSEVLVTTKWAAEVAISLSLPGYREESESVLTSFTVESQVDPSTLEVKSHEVSDCTHTGWRDAETGDRIPI